MSKGPPLTRIGDCGQDLRYPEPEKLDCPVISIDEWQFTISTRIWELEPTACPIQARIIRNKGFFLPGVNKAN